MNKSTKGSCLCGGIKYVVNGKLRAVCACHCTQCRKATGHYVAATQCKSDELSISGETLTWFQSSETAERAFCSKCGSNLFWREFDADNTSIWAGSIDGPTGLTMDSQIHTESKGDYYDLPNLSVISQKELKTE